MNKTKQQVIDLINSAIKSQKDILKNADFGGWAELIDRCENTIHELKTLKREVKKL
jgi:hypothetical protein